MYFTHGAPSSVASTTSPLLSVALVNDVVTP
jgi:hypothetical protein